MTIDAVVIGAGGFGRELLDVIEASNREATGEDFNVIGVIDDAPSNSNLSLLNQRGYTYLGNLDVMLKMSRNFVYFVGVGNPLLREQIVRRCTAHGLIAGTIIHPSASIGSSTVFGEGTVVCGGAQVSTNVRLGQHVHLNPAAVIGHDTVIGDFCSVNPGALISGDVTLGDRTLIGAGAVVLQGLTVGSGSTVGAAACVTREVQKDKKIKGVPAK